MLRHVNGTIRCSIDAFGDDPRPHFAKICSCRPGPAWSLAVVDGLNATIAQRLVPRVEIGPASAGCAAEDDGSWTPCAVMSTASDASIVPDRFMPKLPAVEQQDAALRKLDVCHHIAGANQALRVLGVNPSSPGASVLPLKAQGAATCAVVYTPERGPVWDARKAVFCPTDPRHCLEASCECADEAFETTNVRSDQADQPACWVCTPRPEKDEAPSEDEAESESDDRMMGETVAHISEAAEFE